MAIIIQKERPVVALDISSTGTGVAAWYRGKVQVGCYKVSGDYMRLLRMSDLHAEFIAKLIHSGYPVNVSWDFWVEQPFYAQKGSYDTPIKMAHGVILLTTHLALERRRFSWNDVNVSTWRNKIVHPRESKEAKKEAVIRAMSKVFKIKITDDNIGDALGILHWRLKERCNG